jgi:hypothetical protein
MIGVVDLVETIVIVLAGGEPSLGVERCPVGSRNLGGLDEAQRAARGDGQLACERHEIRHGVVAIEDGDQGQLGLLARDAFTVDQREPIAGFERPVGIGRHFVFAAIFFAAARINGRAASKRATDQRSPFSRVTVEMTEVETPTAAAICLTDSPVDWKNAATAAGSAFVTIVRGVAVPRLMAKSTTSRTTAGASAVARHAIRAASRASGSLAFTTGLPAAVAARRADRSCDWLFRTVAAWALIDAVTSWSGVAAAGWIGGAIGLLVAIGWLPSLGSRGARPAIHQDTLATTRRPRSTAAAASVAGGADRRPETPRVSLRVALRRHTADVRSGSTWLKVPFRELREYRGGVSEAAQRLVRKPTSHASRDSSLARSGFARASGQT